MVGYTQEQLIKTHGKKFKHEYFRVGDHTSTWGKERHIKTDVTKSIPQGAPKVTQRKTSKPATVVQQDVERVEQEEVKTCPGVLSSSSPKLKGKSWRK